MAKEQNKPAPKKLTHVDGRGAARMVDVSNKRITARRALATARVRLAPETLAMILDGTVPKGDALAVARVAGIQAAKRTADLIPLCHPLPIEAVTVEINRDGPDRLRIEASATVQARTGVEMEALTAVAVAALTIYDMCKAVDRNIVIETIQLEEKSGGRSGHWSRQ